ncbi:MAG: hypothetical protein CM15mP120_15820 [Pseudomonadota bacterium]|nr:MAG: hypothetical protein CM15mP120_15820 [Pseudomonadota bacterium]
MTALQHFRMDTRAWLEANCPPTMRTRMVAGEDIGGGNKRRSTNPEAYVWLERMAAKVGPYPLGQKNTVVPV